MIEYFISIYIDNTILYPKREQSSDMWHKLVLASELECDHKTFWNKVGCNVLTFLILGQCYVSLPPENIKKTEFSWYLQGVIELFACVWSFCAVSA